MYGCLQPQIASPRAFYLRPPPSVSSSVPWYGQAVVGVNTLKNMPELCKESCLGIQYANHSLRATAITRMYEGGVPENIIREKSGHRSIKGPSCIRENLNIAGERLQGHQLMLNRPFALQKISMMLTRNKFLPLNKFHSYLRMECPTSQDYKTVPLIFTVHN